MIKLLSVAPLVLCVGACGLKNDPVPPQTAETVSGTSVAEASPPGTMTEALSQSHAQVAGGGGAAATVAAEASGTIAAMAVLAAPSMGGLQHEQPDEVSCIAPDAPLEIDMLAITPERSDQMPPPMLDGGLVGEGCLVEPAPQEMPAL